MSQRTCTADDCTSVTLAKGFCSRHYYQVMRSPDAFALAPNKRVCELPDCNLPHSARGMCRNHYRDTLRGGTRKPKSPGPTRDEYVQARISISEDGCWNWTLCLHIGYGTATFQGAEYRAHRFSYETYVGPIPDGLQIDHLCRNRACVNPSHLEPVTGAVNVARGMAASAASSRTGICTRGLHPMSGPNLYVSTQGRRICRACRSVARAARKAATSTV